MNACSNADILRVIYFISLIVDIIKIIIPIALIIYGLVDFSKSVINSDEKVQKKSVQLFFKRILYGVLVFAVPWIVEVIMIPLGDLLGKEGTTNFTDCLYNANSTCLDAIDSKNITTIRSACDVPEDYKIEEDTVNKDNNTDKDQNKDNNNKEKYYCYVCNTGSNSQYKWSNKKPTSTCMASKGWLIDTNIKNSTSCLDKNNSGNNSGTTTPGNDKPNNNLVTSDKNITFSYQWITSDVMPYALYTPSSAKNNSSTPLIVWLHGAGEVNADESIFKYRGLPAVLNNWSLEGFNAYILCPRSSGYWIHQKNEVYTIIDNIIKEKKINTNKIILVGHSLGGIGVETIADGKTDYYSALVVLSGYDSGVNLNQFKNMPIRGYVGGRPEGGIHYEDSNSLDYMEGEFKYNFGSNNLYILNRTGHGEVPRVAFNIDNNNDNKSDLVEWMLSQ